MIDWMATSGAAKLYDQIGCLLNGLGPVVVRPTWGNRPGTCSVESLPATGANRPALVASTHGHQT